MVGGQIGRRERVAARYVRALMPLSRPEDLEPIVGGRQPLDLTVVAFDQKD
jgi:hypothetical protein